MSLEGQRVLILRPREQAASVVSELERLGALPVLLPALTIMPPEDPAPLERALAQLDSYDWLLLTSANGVQAVFERISSLPEGLRIAAVGPKTAQAMEAWGAEADLIPPVATAESLAEAMLKQVGVRRVLFPRANRAREVIVPALRAVGIQIDDPIAYRSVNAVAAGEALDALRQGAIDWVLVTSPSTLEALLEKVDREVLRRTRLASIGPISSEAIRRHGLEVAVEAAPHTLEALIAAIAALPQDAERG